MSEITNGKRRFLSDEYIPLVQPFEIGINPQILEEYSPIPSQENACHFPHCNCEPTVCENMPYVEKKNV